MNPATIAAGLEQAFSRLSRSAFADALWSRRLDVWPDDPDTRQVIANRLGWLDAVEFATPHLPRLRDVARAVRHDGFSDIVLLGMGGSSLAPEVLRSVIGVAPGFPRFRVLDSVDPDAVREALAPAATSLFVLASKSGSTIEPNVMTAEAQRRIRAAGIADVGSRFIAITDEGTSLHTRAREERFRDVFINPTDIGGRYSALSFFGLVPAALMGIDVDALVGSAREMTDACRNSDPRANPGLALGALMAAAARAGRDKLTLLMPEPLQPFGLWVEQLVAESTGKQGTGVMPIAGESPDVPFGGDRAIVAIEMSGAGAPADVVERARSTGAPVDTLAMPNTLALGAEFFRWEVATATAGFLLEINPFDEPNVQQAKDATRALLTTYTSEGRLPVPEPHAAIDGARVTLSHAAEDALAGAPPTSFLGVLRPGDYFGLLVYLPPDSGPFAAVLDEFRTAVGRRTRCATMLGYGPRYLHSTGQLHKGGPNTGVFIVVTAPAADDLAIPGQPYSFGVLEMAQAAGDFQSLDRAGRRALHLHLPARDARLLRKVTNHLINSF
ncbi:MAG: glucose-6-phosphate isomerase [Acidobacteria bacterium]|nr:glucose-6-phosphate isomerase [Acidobacteriota bacterium]